jgi:hypothetical protein
VVDRLGLREGDSLQISEAVDGIFIKPHRFHPEKLAPLRDKINPELPAPQLDKIRYAAAQDPRLRD